jgi:hypothetical protein
MVKRKGRIRHTYMSDRYEMKYHLPCDDDGFLVRTMWEDSPFVGPESYDLSHVDIIMDSYANGPRYILDGDDFQAWLRKSYKQQQFRP